ncbi:unnamed protein product [Dracunculus medinensis]|uniref:Protein rogdi n=1 Tax=Dracunculus medinensis TaxID=318479 RepID=A0A0N4U2A0_DRAME|nr:unnamed protein product [Dracunculus medinensis]
MKLVLQIIMTENDSRINEDVGCSDEAAVRKQLIINENIWFQRNFGSRFLLELIIKACCNQLHSSNKLNSSEITSKALPEKIQLSQKNGQDVLRVSVTLLAENILQTEVVLKYPKMPGGIYKSSAQPDIHWKLQQLLDVGNYCVKALNAIIKVILDNNIKANMFAGEGINKLINLARSTLYLPRKRTLLELCNFPPNRCFIPPLPPDLVFSYYIGSTRLICAAYYTSFKANGMQNLSVIQSECQLPYLVDLLFSLNKALNTAQQFRYHLKLLNSSSEDEFTNDL